jgi:hypothetical protein
MVNKRKEVARFDLSPQGYRFVVSLINFKNTLNTAVDWKRNELDFSYEDAYTVGRTVAGI